MREARQNNPPHPRNSRAAKQWLVVPDSDGSVLRPLRLISEHRHALMLPTCLLLFRVPPPLRPSHPAGWVEQTTYRTGEHNAAKMKHSPLPPSMFCSQKCTRLQSCREEKKNRNLDLGQRAYRVTQVQIISAAKTSRN
jgi:hypothetical protein